MNTHKGGMFLLTLRLLCIGSMQGLCGLCLVPAWLGTCVQGGLDAAPGASLEVVVADITKPDSLKPDLFLGMRAVICCTAVNVSPKEGDTPNRDKYKQVRPLRPPL